MPLFVLALLLHFGCAQRCAPAESPPETSRRTLGLEHGWNQHPWEDNSQTSPQGRAMILRTQFHLDAQDMRGSELILDELWWTAEVELNGHTLPSATGGNAPARVFVGEALLVGENSLQIRISAPNKESVRETGGWLVQADKSNQTRPALRSPPRLELKPAVHLQTLDLPLSGARVQAIAQVRGDATGGHVRFLAALDGEVLAELGTAPVDPTGQAQTEPVVWEGPLWSPLSPELIQLVAILEDASGTVLDTWARRIGVRQVSTGERGLLLNSSPLPLMATRAVTRAQAGSLEARLQSWALGGVNAIEIHGENAPESWLQQADELGLPVIMLPRCIGRANAHGPVDQALIDTLEDQDRRLVQAMSAHPSVLLWMTEGPSQAARSTLQSVPMWTNALLDDVQDRPVVDHDLGGRVLQIQPGSAQCNGGSCTDAWIAEITGHGGGPSPWLDMSQAYLQATVGEGALGGTIPSPQEGDASWAQTWSILATGLGVPQLSTSPRRASSQVNISALIPGQIAWLEAPWTTPVGGVADASGRLQLETWHQGDATIRSGDWQHDVRLEAGSWENFSRQGTPMEVHP